MPADEKKLKEYADKIAERAESFNSFTLETIGRRIKGTGRLSAYDQQALKNIADITGDMKAITRKLAEVTELNIREVEEMYTQVVTEGANSYKPIYDFLNMEFVPFEKNEYAKAIVRGWAAQTAGEMINLSRTKALCFNKYDLMGNVIGTTPLAGAFQEAIDSAVVAVSTGTSDFNTAMRKTVEDLGGSGVRVDYGNGITRPLESVIRQNVLYGAKQASIAYDEHIAKELSFDGFEVDYHPYPRPSHEFMGGEMFANGDKDITVDGITYPAGTTALARLSDYGCLHYKTGVLLGVSEPRYDRKELDEWKKRDKELIEYNGMKKTGYEWKQAMRRIECAKRKNKARMNVAKASGDRALADDCRRRDKLYREKYDELCKATGLTPQYNRMAVYKGLTEKENEGIIKAIKECGVRGNVYMGIDAPELSEFAFDEKHINRERQHNVDREQAEMFVHNAKFVVERWNGRFRNYFSEEGAVYIDAEKQLIRTAFGKDEFSEEIQKAMEVLKSHGR